MSHAPTDAELRFAIAEAVSSAGSLGLTRRQIGSAVYDALNYRAGTLDYFIAQLELYGVVRIDDERLYSTEMTDSFLRTKSVVPV